MTLTEQELKAIERDTKKFLKSHYNSKHPMLYNLRVNHGFGEDEMVEATVKCIQQERIKAKKLIKYLEEIKSYAARGDCDKAIFSIAVKAINEYNTP